MKTQPKVPKPNLQTSRSLHPFLFLAMALCPMHSGYRHISGYRYIGISGRWAIRIPKYSFVKKLGHRAIGPSGHLDIGYLSIGISLRRDIGYRDVGMSVYWDTGFFQTTQHIQQKNMRMEHKGEDFSQNIHSSPFMFYKNMVRCFSETTSDSAYSGSLSCFRRPSRFGGWGKRTFLKPLCDEIIPSDHSQTHEIFSDLQYNWRGIQ